jgi:hypothetical protein
LQRGLLSRKVGLRSREIGLRLAYTPFRIDARLLGLQLALPQLLLKNVNLGFGSLRPGLGPFDRYTRPLLAGAHLLIVKHREDLPRIDTVALADAHFEDAATRLRGDGGIIAFDSSAERNRSIVAIPALEEPRHGVPWLGPNQHSSSNDK